MHLLMSTKTFLKMALQQKTKGYDFQWAIDILCMSPTDIICISMDGDFHKESKYVFFWRKNIYIILHEKCIHKSLLYTTVFYWDINAQIPPKWNFLCSAL